jgi:hypothetical protein
VIFQRSIRAISQQKQIRMDIIMMPSGVDDTNFEQAKACPGIRNRTEEIASSHRIMVPPMPHHIAQCDRYREERR